VHPSTGYNLCRTLIAAADVADAIEKELRAPSDKNINLDRAAAAAYNAIW
jgi:hypothetical protein